MKEGTVVTVEMGATEDDKSDHPRSPRRENCKSRLFQRSCLLSNRSHFGATEDDKSDSPRSTRRENCKI
jgi:hypothetical protein